MTIASIRKTTDNTWCCVTDHGATHFATWAEAQQGLREYLLFRKRLLDPGPTFHVTRRLQALQAQGYGQATIAKWLDTTESAVAYMTNQGTNSATMARLVREKYAWVMDHTEGGTIRDTGPTDLAQSHRWLPPAAWNNIDDPDETPDRCGTRPRGHRNTRVNIPDTHQQMTRDLVHHFGGELHAARALGWDKKTIKKLCDPDGRRVLESSLRAIEEAHRTWCEQPVPA